MMYNPNLKISTSSWSRNRCTTYKGNRFLQFSNANCNNAMKYSNRMSIWNFTVHPYLFYKSSFHNVYCRACGIYLLTDKSFFRYLCHYHYIKVPTYHSWKTSVWNVGTNLPCLYSILCIFSECEDIETSKVYRKWHSTHSCSRGIHYRRGLRTVRYVDPQTFTSSIFYQYTLSFLCWLCLGHTSCTQIRRVLSSCCNSCKCATRCNSLLIDGYSDKVATCKMT